MFLAASLYYLHSSKCHTFSTFTFTVIVQVPGNFFPNVHMPERRPHELLPLQEIRGLRRFRRIQLGNQSRTGAVELLERKTSRLLKGVSSENTENTFIFLEILAVSEGLFVSQLL